MKYNSKLQQIDPGYARSCNLRKSLLLRSTNIWIYIS